MKMKNHSAFCQMIVLLFAVFSAILLQSEAVQAKSKKSPRATTMLGWGFESGRADETDVEALISDQLELKRSIKKIDDFVSNGLSLQSNYSMLGLRLSGKPTNKEVLEAADKWWQQNILNVIKRIAKNPAASCVEAQEALKFVLGRERQQALLGLGDDSGMEVLLELFGNVRQRCRDEALDECKLTGRYDHFQPTVLGEERQNAALGGGETTLWVGEALKECAVYELHYVSTTEIADEFNLKSVIDGRITLNPVIEGESNLAIVLNLKFEGEANSAVNPFLQKIECSLDMADVICSPGGSPAKSAWAMINKMEIKSKEFYLENDKVLTRPVGKDNLEFTFSPAMVSATALIKWKNGPESPFPFLEVGGTGFYISHKKKEVSNAKFKFSENRKNGYPILFELTERSRDTVEDISANDSTVFQLIHKPKKKQADAKPTTVRKPLQPKQKP